MREKFANLTDHSLIKVQGKDSKKFLQGQLTCDMEEVTTTQSRLAAHCNPKGRVISSFRVWLWSDSYYLSVPRSTLTSSIEALKKYAIFSQVEISEEQTLEQAMIICPEDTSTLLSTLTAIDQVERKEGSIITRVPGKNSCYHIIGPICNHFKDQGEEVSTDTFNLESIQAGIATITEKVQEKFTPHALSLQKINAISFTKGCYTGQEIVARMQYLGKLKEQLYLINMHSETKPDIGQELISAENKTVGTIINSCQTDDKTFQGLAVIKIAAVEKEVLLGSVKIKILPLPS